MCVCVCVCLCVCVCVCSPDNHAFPNSISSYIMNYHPHTNKKFRSNLV